MQLFPGKQGGGSMKIKEVEAIVGMNRANIRFYEDEGLISPARKKENNYREYSMEDVRRLQRIKTLRVLGIPVTDIRAMGEGKLTLDQAVRSRLESIEDEKRNLDIVQNVCENILSQELTYEAVEESLLISETPKERYFWKDRLSGIMQEDITVEIVSRKQLNTNIGVMLIYGYLLNIIVCLLFGDTILNYRGTPAMNEDIFFAEIVFCFVTAVVCNISVFFTSSIKILGVLFHFSALVMTPAAAVVFGFISEHYEEMRHNRYNEWVNMDISGKVLAVFWTLVILYILVRWIASLVWEEVSLKLRYTFLLSLLFTAVVTVIAGLTIGRWITGFAAGLLFSLYLGASWFYAVCGAEGRSRYYAIVEASRIMNFVGAAVANRGKGVGGIVFR